jgi:hypothetical protein
VKKPGEGYSHPDAGSAINVDQNGTEVTITFHLSSVEKAESVAAALVAQLMDNEELRIKIAGKPSHVERTPKGKH